MKLALRHSFISAILLGTFSLTVWSQTGESERWQMPAKALILAPKGNAEVTFASGNPQIVAMGNNGIFNTDQRIFYDLKTGKKLFSIVGGLRMGDPVAVSRNAKFLAANSQLAGKVGIMDLKTKKPVAALDAKSPSFSQFIGDNILVIASVFDGIQAYDVPSGELKHSMKLETFARLDALSVHPTLPRILVPTKEDLEEVSLEDGKSQGTFVIPSVQTFGNFKLTPYASGYSPDGKKVGVVANHGFDYYFFSGDATKFELSEGVKLDIEFGKLNGFQKTNRLQFSQDGSAVLFNSQYVIDAATGVILWALPERGTFNQTPAAILDVGYVLSASEVNGQYRMFAYSKSPEEIKKIRTILKEGGAVAEAALPEAVKVAALTGINSANPGSKWSGSLQASPPMGKGFKNWQINKSDVKPTGMHMLLGEKLLTAIEVAPANAGFKDTTRGMLIYDLNTGKKVREATIPTGLNLMGCSPSGKMMVTLEGSQKRRVDVWNLESVKHVVGFRHPGPDDIKTPISKVFLTSDDQLVTITEKGMMTAWSLPDVKPKWTTRIPVEELKEGQKRNTWDKDPLVNARVTADQKYLAIPSKDLLLFVSLSDGKAAGSLASTIKSKFNTPVKLLGVDISLDGTEAVGLYQHDHTRSLAFWDLKGGKLKEIIPGGAGFGDGQVEYLDQGFILTNRRELIDRKSQKIVWNYNIVNAVVSPERPDGRLWRVGEVFNRPPVVEAMSLPDPETNRLIAQITTGNSTILKPGMSIGVQMSASGPLVEGYQKQIQAGLEKSITDAGFVYQADAPFKLKFSAEDAAGQGTWELREGGRPAVTKPARQINMTVELTHNNTVIWKTSPRASTGGFFFFKITMEKELDKIFYPDLWNGVVGTASSLGLPQYIAQLNNEYVMLPGTTTIFSDRVISQATPTIPKDPAAPKQNAPGTPGAPGTTSPITPKF
jgi:hypothetical protein